MITSIAPIALSGLDAQAKRLAVSGSNVANSQTVGVIPNTDGTVPEGPRPYQPQRLAQTPVVTAEGVGAGVAGSIENQSNSAALPTYKPESPYANDQGLVGTPAIDLAEETVSQIGALAAYRANLSVLRSADEATQSLLDLAL